MIARPIFESTVDLMRHLVGSPLVAIVLLIGCAASLHSASTEGGEASPRIESVEIGFGGAYKVGHWTPVWITLNGGSQSVAASVEVLASDTDGLQTRFTDAGSPVRLLANGPTAVVRYVKPGRVTGDLTVRLLVDGEVAASQSLPARGTRLALPADRQLIVAYGPPIGINAALSRGGTSTLSAPELRELERPEQLPDDWLGLEGVSLLVVTTSDAARLDALSERQVRAIEQWVQLGGQLLICVGERGADVLAAGSRWSVFSPGRFLDVVPLRSVSSLETYAGASQPLVTPGIQQSLPRISRFGDVHGNVLLADVAPDGMRPLLVHRSLGFGSVVLVALDLDQPPFAAWEGGPRLVARILQECGIGQEARGPESRTGQLAHEGYRDLVGQLRTALDQFPGISLVQFSWVAGLALLYIALIGPGDYFLLRDVFRRMQWTWVTFPAMVAAFTGLTVFLHHQSKGQRVQVNQVDVVDVDSETSLVRGTQWAHVYSPETRAYDLSLRVRFAAGALRESGAALSWQGLPGSGLGGMNTAVRSASFARPYEIARERGNTMTMRGVPIPVASTKSLFSRWWGTLPLAGEADLQLTPDGLLRGNVVNPLPVELRDCMVLFENWAYRLDQTEGQLAPGQTARIDRERPFNLEWRLMRRRVRDISDVTTPWDPSLRDVPRIMEMIMFHEAAGGASYTQLTHGFQEDMDLSDHLNAGSAILWARSGERAAELSVEPRDETRDRDQFWTFVRIVFPVRVAASPPRPGAS